MNGVHLVLPPGGVIVVGPGGLFSIKTMSGRVVALNARNCDFIGPSDDMSHAHLAIVTERWKEHGETFGGLDMNYRSEVEMRAAQRHEGDLGTEAPRGDTERPARRSARASDLLHYVGWALAISAAVAGVWLAWPDLVAWVSGDDPVTF